MVRAQVGIEPVEPLRLKGKSRPVPAWRVTAPEATAEDPGPVTPFIGRTEELAALERGYRRARDRREVCLATVLGAPGIGKSRLVREFLSGLPDGDALVLAGRCSAYGRGITYRPLAEMLGSLPGGRPELVRLRRGRRVGRAAGRRGRPRATPGHPHPRRRHRPQPFCRSHRPGPPRRRRPAPRTGRCRGHRLGRAPPPGGARPLPSRGHGLGGPALGGGDPARPRRRDRHLAARRPRPAALRGPPRTARPARRLGQRQAVRDHRRPRADERGADRRPGRRSGPARRRPPAGPPGRRTAGTDRPGGRVVRRQPALRRTAHGRLRRDRPRHPCAAHRPGAARRAAGPTPVHRARTAGTRRRRRARVQPRAAAGDGRGRRGGADRRRRGDRPAGPPPGLRTRTGRHLPFRPGAAAGHRLRVHPEDPAGTLARLPRRPVLPRAPEGPDGGRLPRRGQLAAAPPTATGRPEVARARRSGGRDPDRRGDTCAGPQGPPRRRPTPRTRPHFAAGRGPPAHRARAARLRRRGLAPGRGPVPGRARRRRGRTARPPARRGHPRRPARDRRAPARPRPARRRRRRRGPPHRAAGARPGRRPQLVPAPPTARPPRTRRRAHRLRRDLLPARTGPRPGPRRQLRGGPTPLRGLRVGPVDAHPGGRLAGTVRPARPTLRRQPLAADPGARRPRPPGGARRGRGRRPPHPRRGAHLLPRRARRPRGRRRAGRGGLRRVAGRRP
ncbi:AAA family ATPase [Streptomyces sp. NRRL S-495]|uniref:ATP-binding protein n=1 Tax=Streptomyces sp. NRRL S-495 TaxID=1609133 RepID=UPI00336ABB21